MVGTATDDPGLRTSLVVLDGEGVLADVFPPNEFKGAVTGAVDSFSLVLAYNDISQRSSFVEIEDSVLVACNL